MSHGLVPATLAEWANLNIRTLPPPQRTKALAHFFQQCSMCEQMNYCCRYRCRHRYRIPCFQAVFDSESDRDAEGDAKFSNAAVFNFIVALLRNNAL